MAERPLRELDAIRRDCVRKLRSVQMTGIIVAAILAYFVGEDWAMPKIEEMLIANLLHFLGDLEDLQQRDGFVQSADRIHKGSRLLDVADADVLVRGRF